MAGSGIHSPHGQMIMANPYATFSPFQNTSSPAMHPYTPVYNPFSPFLSYAHYHQSAKGLY
jgi:hypothetical protein